MICRSPTLSPTTTENFTLEVVASSDGYKDYDEVLLTVKEVYINNISPNPASSVLAVEYEITSANSFLMIQDQTGSPYNTYPLYLGSTNITIDISSLQNGTHSALLTSDGNIMDAQIFIKQ